MEIKISKDYEYDERLPMQKLASHLANKNAYQSVVKSYKIINKVFTLYSTITLRESYIFNNKSSRILVLVFEIDNDGNVYNKLFRQFMSTKDAYNLLKKLKYSKFSYLYNSNLKMLFKKLSKLIIKK